MALPMLVLATLLVLATDAAATVIFWGSADPCPDCPRILTFDNVALQQGEIVTDQFPYVSFSNLSYDNNSFGQSAAPGFAGGSLISRSASEVSIRFALPVILADFAYADAGVERQFSVFLGGELVATRLLALPASQSIAVHQASLALEVAQAALLDATQQVQADLAAVNVQTARVGARQAAFDAAYARYLEANVQYAIAYSNFVTCSNPVTCAFYSAILAIEIYDLQVAGEDLGRAGVQLQADTNALATTQQQLAESEVLAYGAARVESGAQDAYRQAQGAGPGPGFVGFWGGLFDQISISVPQDSMFALDTLEWWWQIPPEEDLLEPSSLVLTAGGLVGLLWARRRRQANELRQRILLHG
jgi:hypothetical protein